MKSGVIYHLTDSFGFIREDASGQPYFIYWGSMVGGRKHWRTVNEGDTVLFEVGPDPGHPTVRAVNVIVTHTRWPPGVVRRRRPSRTPYVVTSTSLAQEHANQ